MEKKKGAYWQTIDCGFERFLNEFNLHKGAEMDPEDIGCEDWGMTNLAEKFKDQKKEEEKSKTIKRFTKQEKVIP